MATNRLPQMSPTLIRHKLADNNLHSAVCYRQGRSASLGLCVSTARKVRRVNFPQNQKQKTGNQKIKAKSR